MEIKEFTPGWNIRRASPSPARSPRRRENRLASFLVFLISAAVMTMSAAFAMHVGFAAVAHTRFKLGVDESAAQAWLLGLFAAAVLMAMLVRLVRIDLKLFSAPRAKRRSRPLAITHDTMATRGIH